MRYETNPQSNRAWFADQFAGLRRLIGEAAARARSAQTDLATFQAQQQLTDGTTAISLAAATARLSPTSLTARGGVVTFQGAFSVTSAVAIGATLFTIPAGFRPMLSAVGDAGFSGLVYNGTAWVAAGFLINSTSYAVSPATVAVPAGGLVRFQTSWPDVA